MKILLSFIIFIGQSCSILGVQNEESPKYEVVHKEDSFEIRKYDPYVVAKTTVSGSFKDAQSKAFRKLAGYIFGKNIQEQKIAMTAPVEMQRSQKIAMTSPVQMTKDNNNHIMTFSMPSKYTIEELPTPIDKDVVLEKVPGKLIASIQFSWLISDKSNKEKAKLLKKWVEKQGHYKIISNYSYAGYNPPWTLPFLRKNEIHFEVIKK